MRNIPKARPLENGLKLAAIPAVTDAAKGADQDYAEAYKWASLAAAQDIEQAKSMLEMADEIMTPKQTAEGKRRVAEWRKQHKV